MILLGSIRRFCGGGKPGLVSMVVKFYLQFIGFQDHARPMFPPVACGGGVWRLAFPCHMTFQEQYDDAMFDYSRGEYDSVTGKLRAVLAADPENFDAQLALGMAYYRLGDYPAAITEGLKAEKLRPREQLVHTNLSLFYMKSGDKVTAEKHGLQAKIESWREEAKTAAAPKAEAPSELQMSKPAPQPMKFPSQPWKKAVAGQAAAPDPRPQTPDPKS
jgi:tetratricopeptide (TPR) repeat protein